MGQVRWDRWKGVPDLRNWSLNLRWDGPLRGVLVFLHPPIQACERRPDMGRDDGRCRSLSGNGAKAEATALAAFRCPAALAAC